MHPVTNFPVQEISLRPYGATDLPLLQQLMGDPAMMEHLGGPETPEKILSRHHRYCDRAQVGGEMFVILTEPEGQAAGSIGYWERDWNGEKVWESGWSVLPDYQGRGIGGKALIAVLERARQTGAHHSLHAFPSIDNHPSNAICRRAGFTLGGITEFEYPPGRLMQSNHWFLRF